MLHMSQLNMLMHDAYFTLYTGPKPPCPSLFPSEKFSVACSNWERSKRVNSELFSSILQTKAFSSVLSCKLTFPECRAYTAQFGIHFYDSKSSKRLRIIAYAKQYKPFLRLLNHRKVIDQSRIASKGTATPILHSFLLCPMCKYNIIKQIRQQIFSTETVS